MKPSSDRYVRICSEGVGWLVGWWWWWAERSEAGGGWMGVEGWGGG